MSDVFEAIEAHVVAIGEFLEKARRYRPLAADSERLYGDAARIAAEVRRTSRGREKDRDVASLERRLAEIVAAAQKTLADFLGGSRYRTISNSLARGAPGPTAGELALVFADVEVAPPPERAYLPLTAERGKEVSEPEAAAETLARMAAEGIDPQRGPGVGGDGEVHPIRFFETLDGIDSALVVIVRGEAMVASAAPVLRASELGEILVYTKRLRVPFVVGLRASSPDDWLEVRAGGYPQYRERCRELIEARGLVVEAL